MAITDIPPQPLYGMQSPEPTEVIWGVIRLSSIIIIPIILIIGIIIYLKKKNRKKKK